jgi:hypothetical protein
VGDNGHNTKPEEVAGFYSSQNGTKINISISNVSVTTSSPAAAGFFVSSVFVLTFHCEN